VLREGEQQEKKVEEMEGAPQGGWWLRDSVVEELKGRTWLAGRES